MVELKWRNRRQDPVQTAHAGWSGQPTEKEITINPTFASAINLQEKTKVDISVHIDIPMASSVEVEPLTPSDWEIVELHAGAIESQVTSQTRVVDTGGHLILYPSETVHATLKVLKIDGPAKVCRLGPDTELHVAPKTRRTQRKKSQSVRSVSHGRPASEFAPSVLLRGVSQPHKMASALSDNGYEVSANFDEVIYSLKAAHYVNVSIVPGPETVKDKEVDEKAKMITRKVAAKLTHDPSLHGHVVLSRLLSIALGVEDSLGYLVNVEKAATPISPKNITFTIHPFTTESKAQNQDQLKMSASQAQAEKEAKRVKNQEIKQAFSTEFFDIGLDKTCWTKGTILPVMKGIPSGAVMQFNGKSLTILPDESSKVSFEIGEEILIPRSQIPTTLKINNNESTEKPIGLDDTLKKAERALKRGRVGGLVFGPAGSGKSLFISEISKRLFNRGVHVLKIELNDYARESGPNIKEKIDLWLRQCSWYSPSLLVLEGLEDLFPAESENADSTQTRQLTEYFIQSVAKVTKSRNLTVLASARSKEAVNGNLFSSHCIEESFNLRAPSKDVRQAILEHYMDKYGLSLTKEFDASQMSLETEGYLPSDLKVLVDRIYHEAVYQEMEKGEIEQSQSFSVSNSLFTKAASNYVPSNLRGVKLQKSSTSWVDIGGLTEAKSVLLETLEWPTKYAPIFKAATLRLRSGILLYGYPGCGKTLLASAVAGQCGLNFISVKGPEILNKYIGASEQSVRELFERAQAAKPCILFFDEFDSIAPKRGHDSTGVTDRVVNQMLTQMDGAEGLDGVYVLAATSRPDLIDSALLRPGRLDKSVICDMPNFEDRLDILKSITRKMELADEVDLQEVAKQTEGFSGADLQALGYNAYLGAVHEKLEKDKLEAEGVSQTEQPDVHEFFQVPLNQMKLNTKMKPHERTKMLRQIEPLFENLQKSVTVGLSKETDHAKTKGSSVAIRQQDFIEALKDTKPSISVSEKVKLGGIYNKFVSGRDGNMQDGTSSTDVGARATMA